MEIRKYSSLFSLLVSVIFYACIYYYFYFVADYILYQQYEKTLFLFDIEYFKKFLSYPGGLTEFASNFLIQFYYYKWIGVAILTILAIITSIISNKIYQKLTKDRIAFFHLLPPLLFLALFMGHSLSLGLAYILTSLAFLGYLSFKNDIRKYIFAITAFILLYFISAAFAIIFLATCFLYELIHIRNRKRIFWLVVYLVFIVIIPLVSWRWLFVITLKDAFLFQLPINTDNGISMVGIAFIFFLPLLPIISKFRFSLLKTSKLSTVFNISIPLIVFTVLSIFVFNNSIDKDIRLSLLINELAGEEEWDELLQVSAKNPNASDVNASYTNLALFKTGNLPWDMFRFIQIHNENGLILKWRNTTDVLMPGSDVYFYLGLNNAAYRWAFESLVVEGPSHKALKRLVLTSILNKDYRVAEKYISILEKTIFHKKWAKQYRPFLFNDELVDADPFFGKKVKQLNYNNSFITIINNKPNLLLLLQSNPKNKMAFEYLMAHFLLQKDIRGFANGIKYIQGFDYDELPQSWEEALLIYQAINKNAEIDLGELSISNNTLNHFNAYSQAISKSGKNKEMASKALRQKFRSSYWYYYHFVDKENYMDNNSAKVDR